MFYNPGKFLISYYLGVSSVDSIYGAACDVMLLRNRSLGEGIIRKNGVRRGYTPPADTIFSGSYPPQMGELNGYVITFVDLLFRSDSPHGSHLHKNAWEKNKADRSIVLAQLYHFA